MSKRADLFTKIFRREWNKRFRLVSEDGTPLDPPKVRPGEDSLYEEELEEMELMVGIGEFLDGLQEAEAAAQTPHRRASPGQEAN